MTAYDVEIIKCGSPVHLADLELLRSRGLTIPHDYATWPVLATSSSWVWCRVIGPSGELASGLAIELSGSRAIPGYRIGRVDRIGRDLHESIADSIGAVLLAAARTIPRLLRMEGRVFDEDPARRRRVSDSLAAAGWQHRTPPREYTQTLVLNVDRSRAELLKSFSRRLRNTIHGSLESPSLRYAPVLGDRYADRIRELHALPFARTGGVPPAIDVRGILADSASGTTSFLVGAFDAAGTPPSDLVAFSWARLHGDHAVLEINASDRSPLVSEWSPGFALVSRVLDWAIERGAKWIDLGGLPSMDPAAGDPMRGVIEFKKRFSTDLRTVADEWTYEPSARLGALSAAIGSIARFRPFRSTPREFD